MNEFEEELGQVELLLEDQSVTEIIHKARLANEMLTEHPLSEEYAELVIDELNDSWKDASLKNKNMFVSGDAWAIKAKYGICTDKTFEPGSHTRFINQESIVGGFSLLSNTTLDEEGVRNTQKVYLNINVMIDDEEGVGEKSYVDFLVSLEDSTYIRYEEKSPRKAENWLDYYYPDQKSEILQARLEESDQAKAVMRLQGFQIPIEGLSGQEVLDLKQNLEIYTNDTLRLEPHVPYVFHVCGTMKVLTTQQGEKKYDSVQVATSGHPLILAQSVVYEYTEDNQALEPLIHGTYIVNKGDGLLMCKIAFSELYSFEAVRTIVEERNSES